MDSTLGGSKVQPPPRPGAIQINISAHDRNNCSLGACSSFHEFILTNITFGMAA